MLDLIHENNLKNNITNPAQLWVGDQANILVSLNSYFQKIYCKYNGCGICSVCKQIVNRQYYLISWIEPESNYKTEDIEIIFEKISLSLDNDQKYYFVLFHADSLTQSTAASLLKSIEEPPPGYNFILLAQRQDFIPKTIISRCVVRNFNNPVDFYNYPIVEFFLSDKVANIFLINKALDLKPIDRESRDIIDYLLKYWSRKQQEAILKSDTNSLNKSTKVINILESALENFQMPGSSKIFWRDLYLQYTSCL